MKIVLSLGAGVQSSALALMAAEGAYDLPMPEFAVFADTQAEPPSVYAWLDYLEETLPYPVYRVTGGNLSTHELQVVRSRKSGKTYRKGTIPAFVRYTDEDGDEAKGMLRRRCTTDFKIRPIQSFIRKQAKVPRGCKTPVVEQWIGISIDEAHRQKPSRHPWMVNEWPLIRHGVSRKECLEWMAERGYPQPPRSACTFCPYHSDTEWMRLAVDEPTAFAAAVQFERDLQAAQATSEQGHPGLFLHSQRIPLDEVIFNPDEKKADQFGNECEGMCGV